jgi:hypothetical protein
VDWLTSGQLVYALAGLALGVTLTMAGLSLIVAIDRARLRRRLRKSHAGRTVPVAVEPGIPKPVESAPIGPAPVVAAAAVEPPILAPSPEIEPPRPALEPVPIPPTPAEPAPSLTLETAPLLEPKTALPASPPPPPKKEGPPPTVEELFAEAFRIDARAKVEPPRNEAS